MTKSREVKEQLEDIDIQGNISQDFKTEYIMVENKSIKNCVFYYLSLIALGLVQNIELDRKCKHII